MLIVLSIYAFLIWIIFFQLKLLVWNRTAHTFVALIGLAIALVVVGLLNTKAPSGRVTVMGQVVEVTPVVGGTVVEIPVALNSPIEAGDTLFRIDERPYQYAVDDAQAKLTIAKLSLDRKKAVVERDAGAISQQSVDEAQATFDQARAALAKAQYDLEQTTVRAAGAGIVTSMRLATGDQARPMKAVMPFIRTDSLFVLGVFEQNGGHAMAVGAKVKLAFNAMPGRLFESSVTTVMPGTSAGQVDVGSSVIGAVDVGSTSEQLVALSWPEDLPRDAGRLGMTGTATIFGPDAGAMGILAKVLLWIRMLATYL